MSVGGAFGVLLRESMTEGSGSRVFSGGEDWAMSRNIWSKIARSEGVIVELGSVGVVVVMGRMCFLQPPLVWSWREREGDMSSLLSVGGVYGVVSRSASGEFVVSGNRLKDVELLNCGCSSVSRR